jgi:hypothetical protein
MSKRLIFAAFSTTLLLATQAFAQSDEAAREMARKAQDPLGDVKAIMNDNTIGFGSGADDDVIFNLQIQPVYAIENNTNFNMIARAVIPVLGIEEGSNWPPLGPGVEPDNGSRWGLSDIMLQYFFSPKSDGTWKYGFGPQISVNTASSDRQKGPGNGAGVAAVIFGGVGDWALGSILMQHWGEDNFNSATVQLIAMYNFESIPGAYVGYNNSININWKAQSGDKYTVPLGVTGGRTIVLKSGNGLDFSGGIYGMVAQPTDSPDWQLKLGLSYFFN